MSKAPLEAAPKMDQKIVSLLDRFGCQKGSILEPFWEGKSVENDVLTKLDVKNVIFQKSVFSLSESTILKDNRAWESTKNGSKTLLRGNFFALKFRSRILIDFGLHFGAILAPQMEPSSLTKIEKSEKSTIKNGDYPQDGSRRGSRSSWGGLGAILGGSWGGLEGVWGGPGGGHFGSVLGAKISANSESAIRSNKKQRREARAAESHCEVENKLSGIRATRIWSIDR